MHKNFAAIAAGLALASISGAADAASYKFTFLETSAGVLETGSGSFDLTGLAYDYTSTFVPFVRPSDPQTSVGASGSQDVYDALFSMNEGFGTGSLTVADFGTGPIVGFAADENFSAVAVPEGYTSGDALGSSTALYGSQTFKSLGLTRGTYIYSYFPSLISDARISALAINLNTITVQVGAVPLPASAPMFGAALLAFGAFGYGMRRKKAATAA